MQVGQPLLLNGRMSCAESNLAVVWKISPLFAEWISGRNVLFELDILNANSKVLELGCGVSGIVALALEPYIGRYTATDQDYALKLLKQNIAGNSAKPSEPHQQRPRRAQSRPNKITKATFNGDTEKIQVIALDWELDSLHSLPDLLRAGDFSFSCSEKGGVDVVLACDCIYNEALIDPFVKTCSEICRLRGEQRESRPTLCLIAQQLRSSEVFEAWLIAFHKAFHVWQMPDSLLTESLKQNSGFVVHIGTLRA